MNTVALVQFYSDSRTQDNAGADTVSYQFEFAVPIYFQVQKQLTTTDGEIAPSGKATAIARVPYTDRIGRGWRLKYQGDFYDIESMRDPDGLLRDLELLCVAVEL